MQQVLFVFGLVFLVGIEFLRWLAGMPPETGTALSAIAWLCIGGPPAFAAVQARRNERGNVRIGLALVVAGTALLALAYTSTGCGSRQVVAEHSIGLTLRRGPPCDMSLSADGEEVCRVQSVERCTLTIDGQVLP